MLSLLLCWTSGIKLPLRDFRPIIFHIFEIKAVQQRVHHRQEVHSPVGHDFFVLCCLHDDIQPDLGFRSPLQRKVKSKPQRKALRCVIGVFFCIIPSQPSSLPREDRGSEGRI